jgi:hypothetical protein
MHCVFHVIEDLWGLTLLGWNKRAKNGKKLQWEWERTSEVLNEVQTLWNTLCRQGNPWTFTE